MILGDRAGRDAQDHAHLVRLPWIETVTIQGQEGVDGQQAGSLVSVNEGMIADDPAAIDGGEVKNCGRAAISQQILRPSQGTFEKSRISKTSRAAEKRKRLVMDGVNNIGSSGNRVGIMDNFSALEACM